LPSQPTEENGIWSGGTFLLPRWKALQVCLAGPGGLGNGEVVDCLQATLDLLTWWESLYTKGFAEVKKLFRMMTSKEEGIIRPLILFTYLTVAFRPFGESSPNVHRG